MSKKPIDNERKACDAVVRCLEDISWKDRGARSVLVLENGDMALSNHAVILEASEQGACSSFGPPRRDLARGHDDQKRVDRYVLYARRGAVS
jgi:hypothetical protein